MIPRRLLLAAALVLAASLPAHAENRELVHLGREFVFPVVLALLFAVFGYRRTVVRHGRKAALETALKLISWAFPSPGCPSPSCTP